MSGATGNDGSTSWPRPDRVIARRGEAIYLETIRPKLSKKDIGKFVAIDIETGAFDVSRSDIRAVDKLYKRVPEAQPFLMRIGYRTAHWFGGPGKRWGVPGEPD